MNNYKFQAYQIQCITNLHVGGIDANYDYIDKRIQRDPITKRPIIHSSSLKGAIREYFEQIFPPRIEEDANKKKIKKSDQIVKSLFGSDPDEKEMSQGGLRFFEAKLLGLTIRGIDHPAYFATCNNIINEFRKEASELLLDDLHLPIQGNEFYKCEFGHSSGSNSINWTKLNGDFGVILSENEMKATLSELPIINRNRLENGLSANLWYEEYLPKGSRFYFFIAYPQNSESLISKFDTHILNKLIQIGANATVGYGFCKITKFD